MPGMPGIPKGILTVGLSEKHFVLKEPHPLEIGPRLECTCPLCDFPSAQPGVNFKVIWICRGQAGAIGVKELVAYSTGRQPDLPGNKACK